MNIGERPAGEPASASPVHEFAAMRLVPTELRVPWVPFVWAGLIFTVTLGALNGALNLWSVRVLNQPVPVQHHQAHALAQLFGFMWLVTAGVSFHLAPRLFGVTAAHAGLPRRVAALSIVGVVGLSLGRLGALMPASEWLGLGGATALGLAVAAWVHFVVSLYRRRQLDGDELPRFVAAGAGWWGLAAGGLWLWQLGETMGGPARSVPLSLISALALFGGTASWLFGISLRAGACTLHVDRPSARRQRVGLWAWQTAAVALALDALWPSSALRPLFSGAGAVGLGAMLWVMRPFRTGARLDADGPLIGAAMRGAWAFVALAAALLAWRALGGIGAPQPVGLDDAARHAFALGFCQLAVFAFCGRMLPSFEATTLAASPLYDAGIIALFAGAALRVTGLGAPARAATVAVGISGALAWLGVVLVSGSLGLTLLAGRRFRRRRLPRGVVELKVVRA